MSKAVKIRSFISVVIVVILLCALFPSQVFAASSPTLGPSYTIYDGNTAWDFLVAAKNAGTRVYIGDSSKNLILYTNSALSKKSSTSVISGKSILVTITNTNKSYSSLKVKYGNSSYWIPASYVVPDVGFSIYDYQLTHSIYYYTMANEKKTTLYYDSSDITSTKNTYPVIGALGNYVYIYNRYNNIIVKVLKSQFYTKPLALSKGIMLQASWYKMNKSYCGSPFPMMGVNNYSTANNQGLRIFAVSTATINNYISRYKFSLEYNNSLGLYMIKNVKSGKYLEVKGGSKGFTTIQQYADRRSSGKYTSRQQFQIIKSGLYAFIRSRLGQYIMFDSNSSGAYAGAVIYACPRSVVNNSYIFKWKVYTVTL